MSEDAHKEEKKDEKKKEAKPKDGKPSAIKAMLGPVLAVLVLVGAGVGVGMFLGGMVTPSKVAEQQGMKAPKDPTGHGEGEHGAGEGGGHGKGGSHSILHSATELMIENIVSNIKDTGGKRFVKISPSFWILPEAAKGIGMGGGGHGGGGEPAAETKRIIRARIQEHLKEYSMEEITNKGIERKLEKAFRDIVERELHALVPEIPASTQIVLKVVPADLAIQ
jgi:hypothetical protein